MEVMEFIGLIGLEIVYCFGRRSAFPREGDPFIIYPLILHQIFLKILIGRRNHLRLRRIGMS